MSSLYLLAQIAGTNVAISSDNVDSVVRVNEIIPIPKTNPIVKGLFALRSRVLTLIDCEYRATGTPKLMDDECLAIITNLSGFQYGLLVDKVDDVVSIDDDKYEKALKPTGIWSEIATALIDIDGNLTMIVDPERLIGTNHMLAA